MLTHLKIQQFVNYQESILVEYVDALMMEFIYQVNASQKQLNLQIKQDITLEVNVFLLV